MSRVSAVCVSSALMLLLVVAGPNQAEARPLYHKALKEQYTSAAEKIDSAKCAVCHGGNNGANKKVTNTYAQALREALALKKVNGKVTPERDLTKIKAAMKKIEELKDEQANGKSYGDLLSAGQLPPPATE